MRYAGSVIFIAIVLISGLSAFSVPWEELAPPVIDGIWVRPVQSEPAQPVWGHAAGLRIGLWPMPGPRGLLRVYAPYLGHSEGRMINYIAVEPIVRGDSYRGLSEMEGSDLDGVQGKRFWSGDSPEDRIPRDPTCPAAGVTGQEGGVESLTVYIFVEPFENGAEVYLRLTFRSDRPYEVGIATFAAPDAAPLDYCIVTATMGNYARLRKIYLTDRVVSSLALWPGYRGLGFTDRVEFPLQDLPRSPDGAALFIAAPDEEHPEAAQYAPHTFIGWRYYGDVATQYWRCEDTSDDLVGAVNGRYVYWNSESPIPGGVAIENFELIRPFAQGTEYWFGVTPKPPESLLNRKPLLGG